MTRISTPEIGRSEIGPSTRISAPGYSSHHNGAYSAEAQPARACNAMELGRGMVRGLWSKPHKREKDFDLTDEKIGVDFRDGAGPKTQRRGPGPNTATCRCIRYRSVGGWTKGGRRTKKKTRCRTVFSLAVAGGTVGNFYQLQ